MVASSSTLTSSLTYSTIARLSTKSALIVLIGYLLGPLIFRCLNNVSLLHSLSSPMFANCQEHSILGGSDNISPSISYFFNCSIWQPTSPDLLREIDHYWYGYNLLNQQLEAEALDWWADHVPAISGKFRMISSSSEENLETRVQFARYATVVDSNNWENWFLHGSLLRLQNKDGEALESFQRALRLDSENYRVHLALGNLFHLEKKFEQAVIHCQLANQLLETDIRPLICLGKAYFALGELQEAQSAFLNAQEVDNNETVQKWLEILEQLAVP